MTSADRGFPFEGDGRPRQAIPRLTPFEINYLRRERPEWPGQIGGLAILDGASLLDGSGGLRLDEVRTRLAGRLDRVPQLRRRLHRPGRFRGAPLWVDDPDFDIANHVRQTSLAPPGDDIRLLEEAAEIYGRPLDRRHPLWALWFLTGLRDGQVGALLVLHHSIADGRAAATVMGSLFDLAADTPDPGPSSWIPRPVPGNRSLFVDHVLRRSTRLRRLLSGLLHPGRIFRDVRLFARVVQRTVGMKPAPQTSLNPWVGHGRIVRFITLDLETMRTAAHANGGRINDVVLALWAGGLRRLLASRGEPTDGVELMAAVPVSMRSASDVGLGNQVGTMVVPLPVGDPDVSARLDAIVATTIRTKAEQPPAGIMRALDALAATRVGWHFMLRQRAVNVLVTNVAGPPVPVYVLGARIMEVIPIVDLTGNLAISLCAFSYAGRMSLVVTADRAGFPDLDVLMAGMAGEWCALTGHHPLTGTAGDRGSTAPPASPVVATSGVEV